MARETRDSDTVRAYESDRFLHHTLQLSIRTTSIYSNVRSHSHDPSHRNPTHFAETYIAAKREYATTGSETAEYTYEEGKFGTYDEDSDEGGEDREDTCDREANAS